MCPKDKMSEFLFICENKEISKEFFKKSLTKEEFYFHRSLYLGMICLNDNLDLLIYLCELYPEILTDMLTDIFSFFLNKGFKNENFVFEYYLKNYSAKFAEIINSQKITFLENLADFDIKLVKYVLERYSENIDFSRNDYSCIRYACKRNKEELVKYLCDNFPHKIDLSARNNYCLKRTSNLNILKYLCENFLERINLSAKNNSLIRFYCSDSEKINFIKYFCENHFDKIDLSAKNNQCIFNACYYGKISIVKYLLNNFSNYVYLNPNEINLFYKLTKETLQECFGTRTFYFDKNSYVVNLDLYKNFFNKKEIKTSKKDKYIVHENLLVYSDNLNFESILEKYQRKLKSMNKKSARN